MVRVPLGPAPDSRPLRQQPHQHVDPVEGFQGVRAALAGSEDPKERAQERRGPPNLLGQVRPFEAVEARRREPRARLGRGRHGLECLLGRGEGGRRRVGTGRGHQGQAVEDEVGDVFDAPGVLERRPHQGVDRREAGLVGEPHRPGQRGLVLEPGHVVLTCRLEVQRAPQPHQELLPLGQDPALAGPEHARQLEPAERVLRGSRGPVGGAGQAHPRCPPQRGHVSQPAGSLLQVWLQEARDRAVPLATTIPLRHQPVDEGGRIPAELPQQGLLQRRLEPWVPGQEPGVEHRRGRVEPVQLLQALRHGADGVAHGQPGVPQRVEDPLGQPGDLVGGQAVVEQEQVEVRARRQLGPPVAPYGHQRGARLRSAGP
jgi:hypothetical protein